MSESTGRPECPHCAQPLQAFDLPDNSEWEGGYQLACFNDECPYYERGWEWMKEKYGATASYRFRIDPNAKQASPLAVWSPDALKDRIVEIDDAAPEEAPE